MKNEFRYFRISAEDEAETELTREALTVALAGNVRDVELAIAGLEYTPGEEYRLTDFSFFRADRKN